MVMVDVTVGNANAIVVLEESFVKFAPLAL